MMELPLANGLIAFVDDDDFLKLNGLSWHVTTKGYAVHTLKRKNVTMHRVIMNAPKDAFVDHVDGNKLNNQKSNLRFATGTQNMANRGIGTNSSSGLKGVSFDKRKRMWRSEIGFGGKRIWLGYFVTKELAHDRYKTEAVKLFGEFARFE